MSAMTCGLCGHSLIGHRCGYAGYWSASTGDVFLCHADDHDCYTEWTVHGTRPGDRLFAYARTMAAITGDPISKWLNALRKALKSNPLPFWRTGP